MGWDVLMVRVASQDAPAAALARDEVLTLGTPAEVRTELARVFPTVHFDAPAVGHYDANDHVIHFILGEDDPVRGVLLMCRGDLERARDDVRALCDVTGWRAFDPATETFVAFAPSE